MNLNLTILKDYLPSSLHCRIYGEFQDKLVCSRPLLCDAGTALQAGNTYLLPSELLPFIKPCRDCSIICVGNPVPFNWQESGVSILQIDSPLAFSEVFNEVCCVYNYFDQWETLLRNELEKQVDFEIKNILKLGAELFQNTINVIDHSLYIILKADWQKEGQGKEVLCISNGPYMMNPDSTEMVKNACNLERRISIPYISSVQNSEYRSYCKNLYPLGYFSGCISITEARRPFRDSDFILADYFFSVFQTAFEKHLHGLGATEISTDNSLQKLLNHQTLSPEEQQQLSISEQEVLYCFKLKETNKTSCMPKEYMHASLCTFVPQVLISTIYHQNIIGLLKIDKEAEPERTFLSFANMLDRMNYCAGISNSFSDFKHFDECIIQADYCLNHGSRTLNYFTDHIIPFFLQECTARMSKELLTNEALHRVMAYDARKNTEYLHTLQVYLEHEMEITPTAQALFIHRSSLLKRLKKLTALLYDNDLNDSDTRLYYRLWFALGRSDSEVVL